MDGLPRVAVAWWAIYEISRRCTIVSKYAYGWMSVKSFKAVAPWLRDYQIDFSRCWF